MANSKSQRVAAFSLASLFLLTTVATAVFVIWEIRSGDGGIIEQEITQEEWVSGLWPHYFAISPNPDLVEEENTNLYYDLSLAPTHFWEEIRTDGGDIRIVRDSDETEVAREIAHINTTAQHTDGYA